MIVTLLFPLAGLLTLVAAALLWREALHPAEQGGERSAARTTLMLLLPAMIATLIGLLALDPLTSEGIHFRLPSSVALVTLLTQSIYAIGLLRHGVRGLGLLLLPLTGLPLLLVPLMPDNLDHRIATDSALQTGHLLISMLAYTLLTLAALHAVMHLYLTQRLKAKRLGPLLSALPSLIEIERHMFAQIHASIWLLGIAILSGLVWQWVAFANFALLTHKVLLAIFAWAVLLTLLLRRRQGSWNSRKSSKMVIAAYILLLLAYFGVRLIQSGLQH